MLLVYLFGSILRGETGEDVDLAVLMKEGGQEGLREKIVEGLGTERIDLLGLGKTSPVIRFEVLRTGVLIYKEGDEVENAFELSVLREYKDTAHMRKRQRQILKERTKMWSSGRRL